MNMLEKIKAAAAAMDKKSDNGNEGFWSAETDKAKNGFAIIRFLPSKSEEDLPFVRTFNHGFKNDAGKWFIENCPTTIGGECPVCEANGVLWNTGVEANKEIVRKRKRKTSYISNVLVVSDPKNPDNEGKVFLFKYGKKIFEKLTDAMSPQVDDKGNLIDPDYPAINPFDLDEGANFKLKIRQVEGFANFDKSEFEKPSKCKVDVELIKDLTQFVAPEQFKSYDEIKTRFLRMTGNVPTSNDAYTKPSTSSSRSEEPTEPKRTESKPAASKQADTDDDDMAFFRDLVNKDMDDDIPF